MTVKKINRTLKTLLRAASVPPLLMVFLVTLASSGNLPDNAAEKKENKKGTASYYHNSFSGRKTASGEIFSQQKLTCASNQYPLGTWLRVTNLRNGKSVVVKVNDRMHPRMNRVVDLSKMAAEEIGMINSGIAKVEVENLGKSKPDSL
ncbi:MAG: septal ring lytic transglycosylase RlpA family protein [Chitinophagaceae bacterium]|jgi:rare lipoprotein A|nr:septal ring lytic transglycosylase RlpA family protein [Chitinophagaceae bacterium]